MSDFWKSHTYDASGTFNEEDFKKAIDKVINCNFCGNRAVYTHYKPVKYEISPGLYHEEFFRDCQTCEECCVGLKK